MVHSYYLSYHNPGGVMNAGDLFSVALLAHIAGGTTDSELPKPELETTAQSPTSPSQKATPALKIIIPSDTSPDSSPHNQVSHQEAQSSESQDDTGRNYHRHNRYSPTFISLMRTRN